LSKSDRAFKGSGYHGIVKIVSLPEKDAWHCANTRKNASHSADAIEATAPIDLDAMQTEDKEVLPEEFGERTIHPAIHIEHDFASIGVICREKGAFHFSVLTHKGRPYPAEQLGKKLFTVAPMTCPQLANRKNRYVNIAFNCHRLVDR
jgi:hypothetical protein